MGGIILNYTFVAALCAQLESLRKFILLGDGHHSFSVGFQTFTDLSSDTVLQV